MSVAAAEMPPKPNTPAMMATISPRSRCVVLASPALSLPCTMPLKAMDTAAKAATQAKRKVAREKLDELRKSTGEAWEHLEKGAQSAWDDVRKAFQAAAEEF